MVKITKRQGKILSLIIEIYISTGEPVGSKKICEKLDNAVSSATIRNEMAILTDHGFLEQPHTSAGRIPSQSGYRYYVDNLMTRYELSLEEQERIKLWLKAFSGEPDHLLEKAGEVLAELTNCAVVSSTPCATGDSIKKAELLPISKKTAMIVLLTSSGMLKSRVIRLDNEITLDMVESFYNVIKAHFIGRSIENTSTAFLQTLVATLGEKAFYLSPILITVCTLAQNATETDIYRIGQNNILSHKEMVNNASELMEFIHKDTPINTLLSAQKRELNISIGTENIFKELKNSTTIFSKYSVRDHDSGVVGIIGPTRLDYARLIPGIQYLSGVVGTLLSEALSDN